MSNMNMKQYYLWLRLLPKIGPKGYRSLLEYFETPDKIYYAGENELENVIKSDYVKIITNNKNTEKVHKYETELIKRNIGYITLADKEYPKRLKNIYDPPIVIFYYGNIELINSKYTIGMVGARTPSVYGTEMAYYFSRELAKAGVTVISGLAAGIDSKAHNGAICGRGNTIGVLGSGINVCYPLNNFSLYEEMCKNHLVISENGINESPKPYYFPLRNRIISGLSDVVLVVEAKKKSGSLITADSALEQNKEVYAIPGRVTDVFSEGTNNLIKMGAKMACSPFSIIDEEYKDLRPKTEEKRADSFIQNKNELAPLEKIVYSVLSLEPVYIDIIIEKTGKSVTEVISTLLSLEKKKLIKQPVRGYYIISL